jgi:hypothetical protein
MRLVHVRTSLRLEAVLIARPLDLPQPFAPPTAIHALSVARGEPRPGGHGFTNGVQMGRPGMAITHVARVFFRSLVQSQLIIAWTRCQLQTVIFLCDTDHTYLLL